MDYDDLVAMIQNSRLEKVYSGSTHQPDTDPTSDSQPDYADQSDHSRHLPGEPYNQALIYFKNNVVTNMADWE
ncbi:hypothetical protein NQZ79_g6246 [Umbelopsis isabellina]|nr:hypothetical protein NQZ79_g6246 [Umbelopsis isabellina]